jgi:hypothetical protein
MIESNLIHAAQQYGVKRLLFLGNSCIYPRLAEQPMTERALLLEKLQPCWVILWVSCSLWCRTRFQIAWNRRLKICHSR